MPAKHAPPVSPRSRENHKGTGPTESSTTAPLPRGYGLACCSAREHATEAARPWRHEAQPHVHVSTFQRLMCLKKPAHLPTLARLPAATIPPPLLRENSTPRLEPTAGAATKACVRGGVAEAISSSSSALASAAASRMFAACASVSGRPQGKRVALPLRYLSLCSKRAWRCCVGGGMARRLVAARPG